MQTRQGLSFPTDSLNGMFLPSCLSRTLVNKVSPHYYYPEQG